MTAAGACERFVSAWRIEVGPSVSSACRRPRPPASPSTDIVLAPNRHSRRYLWPRPALGAPWRWDPRMERCDVEWRVDWGLPPGRHRLRRCRPRRSAALAALFVLVRDAVATQSLAPLVQRRMARAAGRIAMNGGAVHRRRVSYRGRGGIPVPWRAPIDGQLCCRPARPCRTAQLADLTVAHLDVAPPDLAN